MFGGTPVIKAVKERFKITKAAIIGPNDQGGTDTVEALAKLYEAADVKTAAEYYQRGTTNFSPMAIRIKNMGADADDFTSLPPGEAAIPCLARKFEHGRPCRDVLAPLERKLRGKNSVKQAGRQRHFRQLPGPQADDFLLLRHRLDLQRHVLRHATGLSGRWADLSKGALPERSERDQRCAGNRQIL